MGRITERNKGTQIQYWRVYASEIERALRYAQAIGRAPHDFLGKLMATVVFIAAEPTNAIDACDNTQMLMYADALSDRKKQFDLPDAIELLAAFRDGGFIVADSDSDQPVYTSPWVDESAAYIAGQRERGAKGGRAKSKNGKTADTQAATGGDYDAPNGY